LLTCTVKDEGDGFNWQNLLESYRNSPQSYHGEKSNPNPHYKKHFPHAQGTALYALFDLCDEVTFNETGNEIVLKKVLKI